MAQTVVVRALNPVFRVSNLRNRSGGCSESNLELIAQANKKVITI